MLGDKFTLEYSPQFYDEISDAVRYITFKLRNPEAAQHETLRPPAGGPPSVAAAKVSMSHCRSRPRCRGIQP